MHSFRSSVVAFALGFAIDVLAVPVQFDPRATSTCLDSSATDNDIQLALYYGGQGTVVSLCPGATIILNTYISYTAQFQTIETAGYPTGASRATLVVNGTDQSVAIGMNCGAPCFGAALRNVQVNGNRPALGRLDDGQALVGEQTFCTVRARDVCLCLRASEAGNGPGG